MSFVANTVFVPFVAQRKKRRAHKCERAPKREWTTLEPDPERHPERPPAGLTRRPARIVPCRRGGSKRRTLDVPRPQTQFVDRAVWIRRDRRRPLNQLLVVHDVVDLHQKPRLD